MLPERLSRNLRSATMLARGLSDKRRPILAHIVPTRRCNLACTYCNEYDQVSDPVPLTDMKQRIDRLAELGTSIVVCSGGEPMLHPDLDEIIGHVRSHGMIAGLITNGFFLSPARIHKLNAAGLEYVQISIDGVKPDEVSVKCLRTLDKKLQHLAKHATFHVNINSVLGGGTDPNDLRTITRRAEELGFATSVGIIHDADGRLKKLNAGEMSIYREVTGKAQSLYTRIRSFQENLVNGIPNDWKCRAGGRYLYICEDGLVHYCSQMRGSPAIPLAQYTSEDVLRGYNQPKECAPLCTIGCVHRASFADGWRSQNGAEFKVPVPAAAAPAPVMTQPPPAGRLPVLPPESPQQMNP